LSSESNQNIWYTTLERIYHSVAQEKAKIHQDYIHESCGQYELVLN